MATQQTRKSLPKNELLWTSYIVDDGRWFYITSTKARDRYFLWERRAFEYTMTMSSVTPKRLMEKMDVMILTGDKSKSKGKS